MTAHLTHAKAALSPSARATRTAATLVSALGLLLLPAQAAWADSPESRGTDNVCSGTEDSDFDDVEGNTHEANIHCLAFYDITQGSDDGSSYEPDETVSRAQMASFITAFIEDYADVVLPTGEADFDDIEGNTHEENIRKLANVGVAKGTGASEGESYAPDRDVSRAQMATLIRQALSWLDDGDATDASAPGEASRSWFDDTGGSVHGPNIDAIADQGIVVGSDGNFQPAEDVQRDQMASFIMHAYDFAVAAELGVEDDTPPADELGIIEPTEDQPRFPISPGDEIEVTFVTDRVGDYTLEYRDPAPEGDDGPFQLPSFPGGDEGEEAEPGPWTEFEGAETSGDDLEAGTHTVSVILPADEPDQGIRDLRLVFQHDKTTWIIEEPSALVISDGVVINTDQGVLEFTLQEAVDAAEPGDTLYAVGEFTELVEIDGVTGLTIGAAEGSTLAGSFAINEADGLGLSDLAITDYQTFSDADDVPLFGGLFGDFVGDPVGIVASASENVSLSNLELAPGTDQEAATGVLVDGVSGDILASGFEAHETGIYADGESDLEIAGGNAFRDNVTGIDVRASGTTVTGNTFTANTTGVIAFGGLATISDNTFDEHANVAVDLITGSADVEGNTFGAANGEHVCYPQGDYAPATLEADNRFTDAHELRTRDEAESRECLGPVPQEDDESTDGA